MPSCSAGQCSYDVQPVGTACKDNGGVMCDGAGSCTLYKRVFVTSAPIIANTGGAPGMDKQCVGIAAAAGLGGKFLSWTSDSTITAAARLDHSKIPYVLLDGKTVVAQGWDGLVSGGLLHAIDLDEKGAQDPNFEVWTATDPKGEFTGADCVDWTSRSHADTGTVGVTSATDGNWTSTFFQFCDFTYQHLICVEQ